MSLSFDLGSLSKRRAFPLVLPPLLPFADLLFPSSAHQVSFTLLLELSPLVSSPSRFLLFSRLELIFVPSFFFHTGRPSPNLPPMQPRWIEWWVPLSSTLLSLDLTLSLDSRTKQILWDPTTRTSRNGLDRIERKSVVHASLVGIEGRSQFSFLVSVSVVGFQINALDDFRRRVRGSPSRSSEIKTTREVESRSEDCMRSKTD